MPLTLEITVQSVEEYLQVLAVLAQAEEDGELGFEFTARPSRDSFAAIADDATSAPCEETSAAWSSYAPSRRTP